MQILWLTLLPFMLFEQCGWATVPLCVLIAFLLLGEPRHEPVKISAKSSVANCEAECDEQHCLRAGG